MRHIEMRQIHGPTLTQCVNQLNLQIDKKEIDPEQIVSIQEIKSSSSDGGSEASLDSSNSGFNLQVFVRTPSNMYAKVDELRDI